MAGQAQVVMRAEWQDLAEERLLDAAALLAAQRWAAAYYICGYAVECGLKACLVKYVENKPHIVFGSKEFSRDCWTHSLTELLKQCELKDIRDADGLASPALGLNWQTAGQWNEDSRYRKMSKANAEKLYEAITHPTDGVMKWIRKFW